MEKISPTELYPLEQYARIRDNYRTRVMEHKKARRLAIGPHLTLYFEDRLTIQYQIQEMLRVERIFEPEGIQDEMDAYNPLIPDGRNLKATMMIEYAEPQERAQRLAEMVGIENKIWLQVAGHARVAPVADEDLERSEPEKTAAVHFLRFEFTPEMIDTLRGGAAMAAGADHKVYRHIVQSIPENIKQSLLGDFD
ncbi:MAG: hypothetical protein A3G96_02790 [Gammaproteobacteria bacterium RIFCSPLOWO2_12_FULL_52_10]|nr:MAG: hypothetical protein A3G96_02790 [Gammaproteobacteria bacterium RIFCSPLOWO2_12_FULL_52_10]